MEHLQTDPTLSDHFKRRSAIPRSQFYYRCPLLMLDVCFLIRLKPDWCVWRGLPLLVEACLVLCSFELGQQGRRCPLLCSWTGVHVTHQPLGQLNSSTVGFSAVADIGTRTRRVVGSVLPATLRTIGFSAVADIGTRPLQQLNSSISSGAEGTRDFENLPSTGRETRQQQLSYPSRSLPG